MKYDEIIDHPHYEPKHHPRVPRKMRAAQFAPYAALTGYDDAIKRMIRITKLKSHRIIEKNLDDERFDLLDD